jgi:hypothetical protein
MIVIQLPPILPGDLDLATVNQQLRDRTARLDWTGVVSAPATALDGLLAGLDLSNDADVLGIDNPALSDTLIDQLLAHGDRRAAPGTATTAKQKRRGKGDPASTPALWTAAEAQQPESDIPHPVGSGSVPPSDQPSQSVTEPISPQTAANVADEAQGASAIPAAAAPSTRVFSASSPADLRQQLEKRILNDLHGPVGGETEEVGEAHVTDRYLVGMLAPLIRNPEVAAETEATLEDQPELQDELAIADKDNPEEGNTDVNIPATDSMFPCSMGMTFCVSAQAEAIAVQVTWGQYLKDYSVTPHDDGRPRRVWKRHPYAGTVTLSLDQSQAIDEVPLPDLAPSVYLRGQMRRLPDGDWLISLFLVNGQQEPNQNKDSAWLFQPKLQVTAAEAQIPDIFIRKPLQQDTVALDPHVHAENQAMAMLYRHEVEFAVGHGVAVHAETATDNPTRARSLSTRAVPRYEVAATKPPTALDIPALQGLVLDMKRLAEASGGALLTLLHPLTTAYAQWIDTQAHKIQDPSQGLTSYQEEAEAALANCRRTLTRIEAGIATLAHNPQAAQAFRFMNQAMWQQRLHSAYAERQRRGDIAVTLEDLDIPAGRSWYPFQLAFILLNLPSTTDLSHPDRIHPTDAIADLLWFPTGGGKTEAYLGLTAYTIGLRRLQGTVAGRDGMHGVAVLMRYTLRLLTLQQFQRATTLICACETIRRTDEATWGTDPFRIGLWVGANNTPNTTDDSDEAIKQYRDSRLKGRGTPHQLTNCPWCGSKLEPGRDIKVETYKKGRGRTLVKCSDPLGRCAFTKGDGLPIVVVDEEIYRCLPTLLIATVDKFAQMPWKGEVQMLFGQVNGYCDRHGFRSPDLEDADHHRKVGQHPAAKTTPHTKLRPPDLIIQDELHLISGPLGTLVGLYETAVDELCTWQVEGQTVRPKVIASTATIRQAQVQVHQLFLRKLSIFPPPGLDIQDNFFSRHRPTTETPGRLYFGICAPGRRLKATMIRVYLAVLAAAQDLYEIHGQDADPWMTLVGYFNSLRELGGMRRLVDDDIRNRLKKMDERGLSSRLIRAIDELTSRKDSTEIPAILDRLETAFDPERQAETDARRKAQEKVHWADPLDIILATNMISVGVDISRLGMMVACGQPKNTAEYIQATSRVGRKYPGLVITVYNWARPRDLSHYERFEHYHATFYQHVEALSVTPFSPGATYRGLFALLAALVRLSGEEFNGNDKARIVERNHPYVLQAVDAIVQRASLIGDVQRAATLRTELEVKIDHWLSKTQTVGGARLKYKKRTRDGEAVALLSPAGQGEWKPDTCLNSLRNVEPTINLILTDQPPDDDFHTPQPYIEQP